MTFAASMEPNRLDIFGVGDDRRMYHQAWVGNNPQGNWEDLGGSFSSRPAVVSWEPNRLDIFAIDAHLRMYHRAWLGNTWQADWEDLGGSFSRSPPDVAAWSANRLDIFALGRVGDDTMYHKAWLGNTWQADWEPLGGRFNSDPAVVAREPNRLDIFAVGPSPGGGGVYGMYHKAWDGNTWQPSQLDWDDLGRSRPGVFVGPPAVVARGPNRLDIFAVNSHGAVGDNAMYQKGWDGNTWQPSGWEWRTLGGTFAHLF
jgi:hypothetical protein